MAEGPPKRRAQEQIEYEFNRVETFITGLVYFLCLKGKLNKNKELKTLVISWKNVMDEVGKKKTITEENLAKLGDVFVKMILLALGERVPSTEITHANLENYAKMMDLDFKNFLENRKLEEGLKEILEGLTEKRKPN